MMSHVKLWLANNVVPLDCSLLKVLAITHVAADSLTQCTYRLHVS